MDDSQTKDEKSRLQMTPDLSLLPSLAREDPPIERYSRLPLSSLKSFGAALEPISGAVRPVFAGAMPEQVRALVLPHVENQDRTLKAALTCDRELVYEAFLSDPLVKGRASEAEARRLVDDMIANTAKYLPAGWK